MQHTAPTTNTKHLTKKRFDQYDDPSYSYVNYWEGRDYEHAAEAMAIENLLQGKHFREAVDVGGGYGRLCPLLKKYADHVVLAEPSKQQLDLAKNFLKSHRDVERRLMQADDLQFGDGSIDLLLFVRVLQHLPHIAGELREIARVLSEDGYAIIEVANAIHFRNRIRYLLHGKRLPTKPVDIRSEANRTKQSIAFVNHNPQTIMRQLAHAGLTVERTLSVSNLRSARLKQMLSVKTMLRLERIAQPLLAQTYFGPSTFFLVRKAK